MKKIFILFTLLLSGSYIAQIQITQIHLNSGSYRNFGDGPSEINAFNSLAPGSNILAQDYSQFSNSEGMFMGMNPYGTFGFASATSYNALQVGLKLPSCSHGTLRFGIANYRNTLKSMQYGYSESHVVDTFISTQTGSMLFIDSTISKNLYGNYSNQQIRIDAAYIYEMNAGNRWAFSAGFGASLGISYQSKTRLIYSEYTNSYDGYSNNPGYISSTSTVETYNNALAWGMNAYVPLGINFKLGVKRAFWIPWVIYTELRPQLSLNTVPKSGIQFSPGIGSASGIRYNIAAHTNRP